MAVSQPGLQAGLLVAIIVLTVANQLAPGSGLLPPLLVLLGGYLLLALPQLTRVALWVLGAATLVTLLVVWREPAPLPLLREAAASFTFLAAFIAALTLLRLPAYRSRLMRRCGRVLLSQPPAWRYPLLSLGTMLFGVVLNLGVLNLSTAMMDRANTLQAAQGREWVRGIRRRRMLVAVLRGFALLPLVSPMGVAIAILLASMPSLRWAELYPYTFTAATLIFVLGWLGDTLLGPKPATREGRVNRPSLLPLLHFCLLLSGLVALVFGCAWLLELRLPQAVLLGVPLGALCWLASQLHGLGGWGVLPAVALLRRRLPGVVGGIGNEVVVMGAGAYLGKLSVSLVGPEVLLGMLSLGNAAASSLAMLIMVGMSLLGLNPIVTATFLASAISQLALPGLSLVGMATAILIGWALTVLCSPFTASMVIVSRVTGLSASLVCYRWNGAFVTCCLASVMTVLFVLL